MTKSYFLIHAGLVVRPKQVSRNKSNGNTVSIILQRVELIPNQNDPEPSLATGGGRLGLLLEVMLGVKHNFPHFRG